jgi:hypothetical protein
MCRNKLLLRVMPHFAAGALFIVLATGGCGSSDEPEVNPCERLREHVLDVSLADVAGVDREQHRAALGASMTTFVSTCTDRLSEHQITCALVAPTTVAIAACTNGDR